MNEINSTLPGHLRLLHFIDDLGRGGTQTWLTILVGGLHRLGYEQRIICLRAIFLAETVQTLRQWATVEVIGTPRLWALEGDFRLYMALKRWRPDIVQTQLPTSDVVGRTLGRLAGVPVVISSIRTRNLHKAGWQLFWDRLTAPLADRVIFNSREAVPFALTYEGVTRRQVVYIPNGVRLPVVHSPLHDLPARKTALRQQLGLGEHARILGMVARLHPQKGHQHLLAAYAQVTRQISETSLLLIGDGPLRQRLEHQAAGLGLAGRVHFLGDRSDVAGLLPLLDVYVHTSLFEGMPNAVLEAMAAARPVIATAVDGTPELVIDNQTGWLVEPANPTALAERLIFALRQPEQCRRVGQAGAVWVEQHFSADRMVAAYHRLYQELLLKSATTRSMTAR